MLKNDWERRCMELEQDIQNLQQDFNEEREAFEAKQYYTDELIIERPKTDRRNSKTDSFRGSRGNQTTSMQESYKRINELEDMLFVKQQRIEEFESLIQQLTKDFD